MSFKTSNIVALGRCTVNLAGTTLVAQYFDNKRGRALAISNTAHGIGGKDRGNLILI